VQACNHDDYPATGGSALTVADPRWRADLGRFVARVVQLDPAATVRLCRSTGPAATPTLTAWASTPFEVLATRSVPGRLEPADVTVAATSLLTALAVERAGTVDPGSGAPWRAELPPDAGWVTREELPAAQLAELAEDGLAAAHTDPHGPSAALLDRTALSVSDPTGPAVRVPMRCLFALSGLGLLAEAQLTEAQPIRLSATRSWLRLDASHGAVVRRRVVSLPLLA
jgi:hypothetical protein